MRAGRLRHRVVIQRPSVTKNAQHEEIATWADLATVWASVEPLQGREYFEAQQVNAETSVRIRLRYRSDLNGTCRIIHGGKTYEIDGVIDPGARGRELQLMCHERL